MININDPEYVYGSLDNDIQAAIEASKNNTTNKRKLDITIENTFKKYKIDCSHSSSSSPSSSSSSSSTTSKSERIDDLLTTNYRKDEDAKLSFLLSNTTGPTSMPKSFYIPKNYWKEIHSSPNDIKNINERILATYGQNIYDAATWQIALSILGRSDIASYQTRRLLSGRSGDMSTRASSKDFKYGDKELSFSNDDALFFRMISDTWEQIDPVTSKKVSWMDWKPILGENSWAAFIGPLQVAFIKYKGQVPLDCSEVQLGLHMLPAIEAMQSAIGGVYHSTGGVDGKNPHDISTENNASLYAGLKMLKEVLIKKSDKNFESVVSRIDILLQGIETFFRDYAYDKENGIFLQGGLYNDSSAPGKFIPSKDFAVDVQTWGMTVLGAEKIDRWFGDGAAYRIWRDTKKRAGFYEEEILRGVGYTDGPSTVLSVEWTCGAILLVKELNYFYREKKLHDLVDDAITMRTGIESLKEIVTIDGIETVAFHYANKRYWIPFGWWANKIPSLTSTAWVLMTDRDFNPFVLGGK